MTRSRYWTLAASALCFAPQVGCRCERQLAPPDAESRSDMSVPIGHCASSEGGSGDASPAVELARQYVASQPATKALDTRPIGVCSSQAALPACTARKDGSDVSWIVFQVGRTQRLFFVRINEVTRAAEFRTPWTGPRQRQMQWESCGCKNLPGFEIHDSDPRSHMPLDGADAR